MTRHNNIVKQFSVELGKLGYETKVESRLTTPQGLKIPDLLAWKEGKSYLLDAQVVQDSSNNEILQSHQLKISKYDDPTITAAAARITGSIPEVLAITLNWRGVWCRESLESLQRLGLSKRVLETTTVKAISGGVAIYANFQGMSGGGDVT